MIDFDAPAAKIKLDVIIDCTRYHGCTVYEIADHLNCSITATRKYVRHLLVCGALRVSDTVRTQCWYRSTKEYDIEKDTGYMNSFHLFRRDNSDEPAKPFRDYLQIAFFGSAK